MKRRTLLIIIWLVATILSDIRPVNAANNMQTATTAIYLPIVKKMIEPRMNTFGVEIGNTFGVIDRIEELQAGWVRYSFFSWKSIEPIRTDPPTYDWSTVQEADLQNLAASGANIIGTVKYTPSWAQKVPGVSCGPVAEESLDKFAQFMQALVQRYGDYPYYVKYWEIGNEPDVDALSIPPSNHFGCWGDKNDPYYGGEYYAEMLKQVYPAIKAVDPQAKVLNGGLLLDCDPQMPPEGKDCSSGNFFEGILRNQGGDYLDIVNFHGYPPWVGSLAYDEHHPYWKHRGGVILGKIDFLREIMTEYNVDKPLLLSESGVGSGIYNPPPLDVLEAQADYVVWLYVRNWANGVIGTIWFTLDGPGWRNIALLDGDQSPRPSFYAYRYLTQKLGNASFSRQITDYDYLRVYEFTTPDKLIWVAWAPDQLDHLITLPGNTIAVFDLYGNEVVPNQNNELFVNRPIYIDLVNTQINLR